MEDKGFKLKAIVSSLDLKSGRVFVENSKKRMQGNLVYLIQQQYNNLPENKELQIKISVKDKK